MYYEYGKNNDLGSMLPWPQVLPITWNMKMKMKIKVLGL
jgi:hypothetical protein